jgi:hypothetical protein
MLTEVAGPPVMMLGQTLKELARASDESAALELLPDLVLLGRARLAAAAADLSLSHYVLGACRAFLEHAGEEQWATLMSRLRDGAEAGVTLVAMAVQLKLDGRACGCGRRAADMRGERGQRSADVSGRGSA